MLDAALCKILHPGITDVMEACKTILRTCDSVWPNGQQMFSPLQAFNIYIKEDELESSQITGQTKK